MTGRSGEKRRSSESEKTWRGQCTGVLGVRSRREAQGRGEKGKEERQ